MVFFKKQIFSFVLWFLYVGDEAVMIWNIEEGLRNLNGISVYYSFSNTLISRANYYKSNYGFVPFFKAAIHIGLVTVAEVGVIKREVAYHSDVLNTTTRIQSKCNELKAPLLISKDLKEKISNTY